MNSTYRCRKQKKQRSTEIKRKEGKGWKKREEKESNQAHVDTPIFNTYTNALCLVCCGCGFALVQQGSDAFILSNTHVVNTAKRGSRLSLGRQWAKRAQCDSDNESTSNSLKGGNTRFGPSESEMRRESITCV
jgi:hypothetical protein